MASEKIKKLVEEMLKSNKQISQIKEDLLLDGHAEEDIDFAINSIEKSVTDSESFRKNYDLMKKKFFLDKVGFGLASNQFINILFSMTGAGIFLIGIINAIKAGLSTVVSSVFKEYSKRASLKKSTINIAGVIFGFSFLIIALAVSINSQFLFALSLLLGSIGVVIYGDLFKKYRDNSAGIKKKVLISPGLALAGLILTFIAMVVSGILMDMIPLEGKLFSLNLLGGVMNLRLHGFLMAFEATAIVFILSSFMLSKMDLKRQGETVKFSEIISDYYETIIRRGKGFFTNKYLLILGLATLCLAIFQSVVYSLAGVFIFENFKDVWLGGFTNIAIAFGIPLLLSLLGPVLASKLNRYLGLSPLLVFGSLLVAIFPLTLSFNAFLPAIIIANVFAVLGASIIGTAQSLLAKRLLKETERNIFYTYSSLILVIPFIIITAILLLIGANIGFEGLFKIAGIGTIITLVPLYLLLVFWSRKRNIAQA